MQLAKKAAEKAEKDKVKADEAAANPSSVKPKKADEEEISPNEYFKLRSRAVEELKSSGAHPYPHKFHVTTSLTEFLEKHQGLTDGETLTGTEVRVAGRIHAIRESGPKLIFYDVRGEGVKLQVAGCRLRLALTLLPWQVMATAAAYKSEAEFLTDTAKLRRGDILGAVGSPGRYS
jgi:lysyl-tRNA synthetase class 2